MGSKPVAMVKACRPAYPAPVVWLLIRMAIYLLPKKCGGKVRKMAPDGTITTIGGSLSVNFMPTHVSYR